MPLPRWLGRLNRRVFNRTELERGTRPVLHHVGRTTGVIHSTPLDAHPVEGGYAFILMYGSGSDWVRNVVAAGRATLEVEASQVKLVEPRIVSLDELPADVRRPAGWLNVTELLRMDREA